jgi:TPR repeat protein
LNEFSRRGILDKIHTIQRDSHVSQSPPTPAVGVVSGLKPIFIDFSTDSVADPEDTTLLRDALTNKNEQSTKESDTTATVSLDSLRNYETILSLSDAAEAGNPEALTMLGRANEKGIGMKKDALKAALYYVRASRFDSPWAPMLLWKMIHRENFFDALKREVDAGNLTAEYIWAMLITIELDNQITEPQALKFLEDAAKQNYLPAIVELGLCLYTGRWVKQDTHRAIDILQHAVEMGCKEATLQLCAISLRDNDNPENASELIQTLRQFAGNGSVLAESVLGYCYQIGRGVDKNIPESVRLYRRAAGRGSQIAYRALRALYNNVRPDDLEFKMNDE